MGTFSAHSEQTFDYWSEDLSSHICCRTWCSKHPSKWKVHAIYMIVSVTFLVKANYLLLCCPEMFILKLYNCYLFRSCEYMCGCYISILLTYNLLNGLQGGSNEVCWSSWCRVHRSSGNTILGWCPCQKGSLLWS